MFKLFTVTIYKTTGVAYFLLFETKATPVWLVANMTKRIKNLKSCNIPCFS